VQRVSKETVCLTSRVHGETKAKCSGQARLVCRALPVVLRFLQYKNFPKNESVSVVRWKRGENDSNVVGQVGSASPTYDTILLWSAFFWNIGSVPAIWRQHGGRIGVRRLTSLHTHTHTSSVFCIATRNDPPLRAISQL
jgi:hypothetical protein